MFSCEDCEIFKNTYFEEHLRTAAFELKNPQNEWILRQLHTPNSCTRTKTDIVVFTKKELDGETETRILNLNWNKTLISYGEKFAA